MSINHLQDYKICVIVIKMFISKFLNNLPQPLGNNPWPKDPTNKNFKTQFHQQCDYLLGFQVFSKIKDLVLEKKRLRNDIDVKDDPYKTPTLAYNREMDQLVVANIVNIKVEGENIMGLVTKKR